MSADLPSNLLTNAHILHDYQEIAYIVCADALSASTNKSGTDEDSFSTESVLARLRAAERQFRQASILVVLDTSALELITFYKKADIVKDQQTILARFSGICKANTCKIERKHACRIIDLLKNERSRIWRQFSEAILASLVLRTPNGKRMLSLGEHAYLVPDSSVSCGNELVRTHCEARYRLYQADLQILLSGHILLIMRESLWPPMYSLSDVLETESLTWNLRHGSTVYLIPTGQLARYTGGWIGKQGVTDPQAFTQRISSREDIYHRSCWFDKVREWLDDRSEQYTPPSKEALWCSVEIPVLEDVETASTSREVVTWRTVIWPVDLAYVIVDTRAPVLQDQTEDIGIDPLSAAQSWFTKDLSELRTRQRRDTFQASADDNFNDGNFFDDDTQFGSPQQFTNAPPQAFHSNHIIYPTPPEAVNVQNTPGFSMDGAAQTPVSAHQTQPSMYQSSPLAATTDAEVTHPNGSAISSFLQQNDDDLFEDEQDPKLAQPSFGDEPNWGFFDRDPPALDYKPNMRFEEPASDVALVKPAVDQVSTQSRPSQVPPDVQHDWERTTLKEDPQSMAEVAQAYRIEAKPSLNSMDADTPKSAEHSGTAGAYASIVESLSAHGSRELPASSIPPGTKRRRSSIYDMDIQSEVGHDHKYGLSGKYHFELRKPSATMKDLPAGDQKGRRSSSSSSSSWSTLSRATSADGRVVEESGKSWTRYDPGDLMGTTEISIDNVYNDPVYLAQIDELLEIVSKASGNEPFTNPPPFRQDHDRKASARKSTQRWYTISQILTEMLTQSSLFKSHDGLQLPKTKILPAIEVFIENTEHGSNIASASLSDLLKIQIANNSLSLLARSVSLEMDRIRLRQSEGEISAELPIIKYWETMNLQPWNGTKNVQTLCLYPEGANYRQSCDFFMQRMRETYTACNLGNHERLRLKDLTEDGTLAWAFGPETSTLSSLCRSLGESLGSRSNSGCTVVYVTLPNDDLFFAVDMCDAFLDMFEALGPVERSPENDIVLQLVPSSFMVHADSLVVRPQKEFVDLALEVYNRVPCRKQGHSSITAGAIVLEKSIGKPPQFELNSKICSPSSGSGHCFHLAYCTSSDQRWLVAAWSDSLGNTALTLPYCLIDGNDGPQRTRAEIFQNMVEVTNRLMDSQKGQSWLTIAKIGLFEQGEIHEWQSLWQPTSEHKFISRIVLVNVELQSRISLHGPHNLPKRTSVTAQPPVNALTTPATTPQAAITSPDQTIPVTPTTLMTANASTPPDLSTDPGVETDTYLVSLSNEAWAMTFSFGLNQTHDLLEFKQAMASGLLIKRNSQHDNDGGLSTLNVNLISILRNNPVLSTNAEREQLLQDILAQYRALHVLAVVRRCVDDTEGCVPWHIATAFKGARILEKLM